jgi:hypothetical protein
MLTALTAAKNSVATVLHIGVYDRPADGRSRTGHALFAFFEQGKMLFLYQPHGRVSDEQSKMVAALLLAEYKDSVGLQGVRTSGVEHGLQMCALRSAYDRSIVVPSDENVCCLLSTPLALLCILALARFVLIPFFAVIGCSCLLLCSASPLARCSH